MIPAEQQPSLRDILRQEVDAATALLKILGEEYAALTRRDADNMEAVVAAKKEHIATLEHLSKRQVMTLQGAGYALDSDGLQCYVEHHDRDGRHQLRALLDRVKHLLMQCKEQNELNGRLVALGRQHTQHALALLRGEEPAAACYAPKGTNGPAAPSKRMLAKA